MSEKIFLVLELLKTVDYDEDFHAYVVEHFNKENFMFGTS
jgi:hypothetical protein